jgi:hypothetical protein
MQRKVSAMKNAIVWDIAPPDFVRIGVSEERIVFIIRVTIMGELGITLAVTSNRITLRRHTVRKDM